MPHVNRAGRVAGSWLGIGSFLMIMILVLLIHGPISPDLDEQMRRVADGVTRWRVAHWLAAASLSLYAVSGLIMLSAGSRLTAAPSTMTAWAVVVVGALWTMTTAVAETTVVAGAAASGASDTFQAWWAFAEGKAAGFAFVALAVAVIAGNEARSPERIVGSVGRRARLVGLVRGLGAGHVGRDHASHACLGRVLDRHECVDSVARHRVDACPRWTRGTARRLKGICSPARATGPTGSMADAVPF